MPPKKIPARSGCPIAGALDVLGDRWTLLVVRAAGAAQAA